MILRSIKPILLNIRKPLSVTYCITNRCNFRCKYCDTYNMKTKELTTAQAKELISELKEAGTVRLGFSGGEPLLRKDIGELINYSTSLGIVTTVFSNGWLVGDKAKDLKNLDALILSFDGEEEIHDKVRNKGSYTRVIQAMETANKYKIPVLSSTTLTKYNLNSINFILEVAEQYGFKTFFQPAFPQAIGSKTVDSIAPPVYKLKKTVELLLKRKKEGYPIICSEAYLKILLDYPKPNWAKNCKAGHFFCAITSNGDVSPCFNLMNEVKQLNSLERGFKYAFENMPPFKCNGCWCYPNVEENCIFSFNFNAIINTLVNLKSVRSERKNQRR